jgi:uncharacterized paraquat-inducible protein A
MTEHEQFKLLVRLIAPAIVVLVAVVWLIRKFAGPAKPDPEEQQAIRCGRCGYYLVPSDTTCPKCHTPLPPRPTPPPLP